MEREQDKVFKGNRDEKKNSLGTEDFTSEVPQVEKFLEKAKKEEQKVEEARHIVRSCGC
jgi:hypothetical protein